MAPRRTSGPFSVPPPVVQREVDFITMEELNRMTPADLAEVAMRPGVLPHRKGPWSPEESARLSRLVELTGPRDWVIIASYMGCRNAKQCRERFHQNINPLLRHDPISEGEAKKIMALYREYGTAWARIAEKMPGRSDNSIKNYVNGLVNKSKRAEGRLASQQQQHQPRTAARRRSSALSAHAAAAAASLLTASPTGAQPLQSPTFSDMTESDGGNNYSLSSSWGQLPASVSSGTGAPGSSRGSFSGPLDFSQPLTHRAYEASPYSQTLPLSNGFVQQQDNWRPVSRSSEPALSLSLGADLAKYSLSGSSSRESTAMQTAGLPAMEPQWRGSTFAPTPMAQSPALFSPFLPSPAPGASAAALSVGQRVDSRMAIASLLG
ncbi:myb-like dna-binding [Trichoderma arundinaceum]|uniref:Myb-like dna-binding n=1 Tax=Trichoderma arundinaceum TaxID=490622 RepID=A0A395NAG6_TRIAR|nr:myb-like dna-binding [Trichoderma arundinaceum]